MKHSSKILTRLLLMVFYTAIGNTVISKTATAEAIPPAIPEKTIAAQTSAAANQMKLGHSNKEQATTPQPPLRDSQQPPSYEPKNIDTSIKPETPKSNSDEAETTTTTKDEQKETAKKWSETYPVSVNADWLQLKSGEWLRGRITILQKDSLEFDSDELNELVIKWKNVKYLKSVEPYNLRFDSQGRTPITGIIEVIGDTVTVTTDYDEQTFSRRDLNTIASGKNTELSFWKSKITFSLNLRQGNTNQTDFTSKINAQRRTTDSRLILDYLGNFTEVEDAQTINNHRLNATFNFYLTRYFFLTPLFSEFFRDPFQNIDQRLKIGSGAGFTLIDNNKTEWDISGGPGYQETKFDSVEAGQDKTDGTFTLTLGTTFETELNQRVDMQGLYSMVLGDKQIGNYSHHALLTVETELTDKLDLDITAVWDYIRKPVADANGNTPEKDDFRIMIGLGYDL